MSKKKLTMLLNKNHTAGILLVALVSMAVMWGRPTLAQDTQSTPVSIEASVSLEWDQTAGVYTAIGDAIVEQGDKSLAGDEIIARYDTQSAARDLTEVTATGGVIYRTGDSVARGSKIHYVIDTEAYDLSGPGAIVTSPRGTMTAEKTITYTVQDSTRKQVIGIGNAAYRGEDGRIVEGERVVAFLDADSAVETIEAIGNTKVVTPKGIVATADRLDYVAATDRADLFGNVEIIDRDNILRGARAEVEFDKEISRLLSDNSGKRVTGVLTP
ncbi:MAG: LptA/OstA family protein [Candidatus Puniceispirillaceae bacterium]|jgi:lipopolysaccharide export system protein LptA